MGDFIFYSREKGAAAMPLLLFCFRGVDPAPVDVQQFAEISNLSKLHPSLYLYGFEGLSFFGFCANEPKNDGVLNDYCNYITG